MSMKSEVIAELLKRPEPDDMLLYRGEVVDSTWPQAALLALVHELSRARADDYRRPKPLSVPPARNAAKLTQRVAVYYQALDDHA